MKTPENLVSAIECGVIQEVVRPLMSGKEAQVYVVVAEGRECVAKVYKEATQRTFKHRAAYAEGRRTRNSRDQRAMSKRSRHGRAQDEAGWRNTEVDMIWRLRDAGVRVPAPMNYVDGVLVMELVQDAEGNPAPRLGDLSFTPSEARDVYQQLLREVARMLCAGVIHGDLSEFNVLMGAQGPVLIDFPQSMDPARNQGARKFLLRDVENLHRFVERHAPGPRRLAYGEEMWSLYEANRLEPDTVLGGRYRGPRGKSDTGEVMALIEDADRERALRGRSGAAARGEGPAAEDAPANDATANDAPSADPASSTAPIRLRTVVDFTPDAKAKGAKAKNAATKDAKSRSGAGNRGGRGRRATPKVAAGRAAAKPASEKPVASRGDAAPKKRRSRRRRKPSTVGGEAGATTETPSRGGSRAATAARSEKKKPAAGKADASKKRSRNGQRKARSDPAKAKAGSPAPDERPARPEAGRRGASRSGAGGDGAARPVRRRRSRSRSAASRPSS